MKIGIIGLGNMGLAICGRLTENYGVVAYDLSAERQGLAQEQHGAVPATALLDMTDLKTVVLSLPHPSISYSVVSDLVGVLDEGSVIIETSTTTPDALKKCAAVAAARGIQLIDAAVLSGVADMAAHRSKLVVGGPADIVDSLRPVLETVGKSYEHLGELGAGMAAKVINNAVAHAVMVVLDEAFALARVNGVSPQAVCRLLEAPEGGLMRPLTHRIMERTATNNYEGGMSTTAARKDSELALAMAQSGNIPLFAIQGAHTAYEVAVGAGYGDLDYAALAKLWEGWTGNSLAFNAESGWVQK